MKKLNIAFEDKNILVINKPSGVLTIATDKEKEKTLYHEVYNYLHKKNQKVFIVNRLDKDTSGFVVFAKNEKAKLRFQSTWDKVIRKYYGVVIGKIEEPNKVINYIYEGKDLKTYVTNDKNKGKKCITEYTPIKNTNKYTSYIFCFSMSKWMINIWFLTRYYITYISYYICKHITCTVYSICY